MQKDKQNKPKPKCPDEAIPDVRPERPSHVILKDELRSLVLLVGADAGLANTACEALTWFVRTNFVAF